MFGIELKYRKQLKIYYACQEQSEIALQIAGGERSSQHPARLRQHHSHQKQCHAQKILTGSHLPMDLLAGKNKNITKNHSQLQTNYNTEAKRQEAVQNKIMGSCRGAS